MCPLYCCSIYFLFLNMSTVKHLLLCVCYQVTWDGHSGSMARTQQAAQANITLQEQIEAIHKAKGLVGEDDAKEKIGPSKPSEIPHQLPLPSSPSILQKPNPPLTAVPRPPSTVSCLLIKLIVLWMERFCLIKNLWICSLQIVGPANTDHPPTCCTCTSKATSDSCGAPHTRPSYSTGASHDTCSPCQCGPGSPTGTSHFGTPATPGGRSCR